MRILFFISERDFGLGTLMAKQAINFNRLDEVDFLFITGGTEKEPGLFELLKAEQVNYIRIDGLEYHKKFRNLVLELKKLVVLFKPDVVHVQTNWQLALILVVKYFCFKKFDIVYTVHGFRNNSKYKSLIFRIIISFFFALFVKRIIVCSSYVARKFSVLKHKISLLFLGVDPIYLESYDKICVSEREFIFIYPAVFRKGKNQEKLIAVFHELMNLRGKDVNLKLVLPGEGEYKSVCMGLAKKLGINDKVSFPGFLSKVEIVSLMKNNCIAIIPSDSETFGLCIAEPFAFGNCVVSKNIGVASDVINSGENGFLYQDDDDLLSILNELIEKPELVDKCGRNARKSAHRFDWDIIAKEYKKIIFNVFE